jgi:hypothetical protein
MIPSVPFLDLATELVSEVLEGTDYLGKLDSIPNTVFVAPQVDVKLMCFIYGAPPLEIIPSNAVSSNYYDTSKYESVINIQLKNIPRRTKNV